MHLSYLYVLFASLTDILVHKTNGDLICSFFQKSFSFVNSDKLVLDLITDLLHTLKARVIWQSIIFLESEGSSKTTSVFKHPRWSKHPVHESIGNTKLHV